MAIQVHQICITSLDEGLLIMLFKKYGHCRIRLNGRIKDVFGTQYDISGSYDVHVARPLDVDVFPEPGTPLEPNVELNPRSPRRIPVSSPTALIVQVHDPHPFDKKKALSEPLFIVFTSHISFKKTAMNKKHYQ
jgi:hypothetical protein